MAAALFVRTLCVLWSVVLCGRWEWFQIEQMEVYRNIGQVVAGGKEQKEKGKENQYNKEKEREKGKEKEKMMKRRS